MNKLVENCVWSQKSNFCGIPTDCPTRERAGWTGDAGIFVDTGLDLMDCYPVFAKWLGDCRKLQHEDGKVAMIAPVINRPGFMTRMLAGSAGWGDASILVPWAMYKRTGDLRILEEKYPLMQRWFAYLESRTKSGKLKKLLKKNPWKRYLICSGLDYGEWCEPGIDNIAPPQNGIFRPVKELKGFERVELAPGETGKVEFTLDDRSFAIWQDGWKIPGGTYTVQIGASSRDIRLEQPIQIKGTG